MLVRDYLKNHVLLFDGAMGSYHNQLTIETFDDCEIDNLNNPQLISKIHEDYLEAGAKAIKTNTFMANELKYPGNFKEIIKAGFDIAIKQAGYYGAYVFCDIGPINEEFVMLKNVVDEFIGLGAQNFIFETLSSSSNIDSITKYIKEKVEDSFIIVSFSVNAQGYSNEGEYFLDLIDECNTCKSIDSVGLNCSTGPRHLNYHLRNIDKHNKPIFIGPNAAYPTVIGHRTYFRSNEDYYASEMIEIANNGAKIIGGCCGTTPRHIEMIADLLPGKYEHEVDLPPEQNVKKDVHNPFMNKLKLKKKVIAVELDSPLKDDITKFMERAHFLQSLGIDIMTIADNPLGRARMDSSLVACKVKRELGLEVLPHLTCRDRNINATKGLLLGLSVEGVHNVLVVTGDPLPSSIRDEVRSVYEFNSRKMAKYITNLNRTDFSKPFNLMGALNVNARNFDVQIKLAKEKIENGVTVFLTQPVMSEQSLINLKRAHEELDAYILAGILPIVSYRNALFIDNEIPGIEVKEDVINRYKDKTKEESTIIAVDLSSELIHQVADYCDGYYLMTPFNRVDIIESLIGKIRDI